METPKLYHRIAFRLTVYALLATIGGINIWGEHLSQAPAVHAQTISPSPIYSELPRPSHADREVGVSSSPPAMINEFGIEIVFKAYGRLLKIFL